MSHPYFEKSGKPRVLAHRGLVTAAGGDSGIWENSAASFAAAHAAGADYIETDCRRTADGDVVLFHDDTLARLTGDDRRPVREIATRELRRLFEDHGGLLTVSDALDAFPTVRFNIDVKTRDAAVPLGELVVEHTDRVLVSSFSDENRRIAVAAALRAGAGMRPATSAGSGTIARVRALSGLRLPTGRALRDVDALQIPERHRGVRVLTAPLLRAAHRRGVEVHVWTVNDAEDMRRLLRLGVDGLVTDRADVALATVAG